MISTSASRVFALFFCIHVFATAATPNSTSNKLAPNFGLDLQAKLARLTLNSTGDHLYWLNQSDGQLQRLDLQTRKVDGSVDLQPGAVDFCLSRDGSSAYIACSPHTYSPYRADAEQRGSIQIVATTTMTVTRAFDVPIDIFEIARDDADQLYATPGSGQWVKLYKIDPRRGAVSFAFGSIYGMSNLRASPRGRKLYMATNGLSPGDVSTVAMPTDAKTKVDLYDSPYHGDYPLTGAFDLTPDGKFLVNRWGTVLRLGTSKSADMIFVTALGENRAAAYDVEHGRCWLLLGDGRLVTYSYPKFELQKTEYLLSSGSALIFDSARETLWVAWTNAKGGIGGVDAYELKNPVEYPNEISKARETTQKAPPPSPAVAASLPPGNTPSVASAVAAAADPQQPLPSARLSDKRVQLAHRDPLILSLVIANAVVFVLAIILRRRSGSGHGLRISPEEQMDDPRYWPLPTSIRIIGWFGFFQTLLLCYLAWFTPLIADTPDSDITPARILTATALINASFCFGIVRGSKIGYGGYAALQIAALVFSLSQGMAPGLLTVLLIAAVIHYGRKHWEHLS